MGQIILIAYAVIVTATVGILAYYLSKEQKVISKQEGTIKELKEFIEYYKKETNRLRDSLASNIGQLQVARAEMLLLQKENKQYKSKKNTKK